MTLESECRQEEEAGEAGDDPAPKRTPVAEGLPALDGVGCRPAKGLLVLPGLLALLGGMFFLAAILFFVVPRHTPDASCGYPPPTPASVANKINLNLLFAGFGVALIVIALEVVYWTLHARVEADAMGIRYRRWAGWRSVEWNDVRDFYELRSQAPACNHPPVSVIETPGHRFSLVQAQWGKLDALRQAVRRNATKAPATEWGIKGGRPCDNEPMRFAYRDLKNWLPLIVVALALVSFPIMMWPHIHFRVTLATMGWSWALADIAALLALPLLYSLKTLIYVPCLRRNRQYHHDYIETTDKTIAYFDGTDRIEVPRGEVLHYCPRGPEGNFDIGSAFAVVTARGVFQFRYAISDGRVLQSIIEKRAPAGCGSWERGEHDPLGDRANRTVQCASRGEVHRYDYWNRTWRAMLLFPAFMGILSLFGPWIRTFNGGSDTGTAPIYFGLFLLAATLWIRHSLKSLRVCVYTTKEGIGCNGFFGSKFIPWREVVSFDPPAPGNSSYAVVGRSGKIRIRSSINYFAELRAEVEGRVHGAG